MPTPRCAIEAHRFPEQSADTTTYWLSTNIELKTAPITLHLEGCSILRRSRWRKLRVLTGPLTSAQIAVLPDRGYQHVGGASPRLRREFRPDAPAAPSGVVRQRPVADRRLGHGQTVRRVPDWSLRIECDRCGKMRMISETHIPVPAVTLLREILERMRHDGCGGRAGGRS